MDAWMKGGTFEGQKATDELVLAHWKERVNGVSKDDPLHDTYENAHTQLDYTIHESKMTAAYAQHKKTDAQMVAFYLGWAKKVPKNSEFYRVLQRDAGQYMRTQRATAKVSDRAAKEAAYERQMNGIRTGKEAASEYIIDTIRRIAQSGYADGGLEAVLAAPGSTSNNDLTDFDPQDPEEMLKLLGVVTPVVDASQVGGRPGSTTAPNADIIFHDDNGRGVTGQDIINQLASLDPSYVPGSPLDVGYVTGLIDRQIAGLDERIALATKTGHLTDADNLTKSKSYVANLNRQVAAWPVEKAYADMRRTFDMVKNDPTASPQAVLQAWQAYQSGLYSLADDPRIADNDNFRSRIVGEANGDSVPTLAESFTGAGGDEGKDSANTKAQIEFLTGQVDAVNSGAAVWTYGKTGDNGVFVPQAGGTEIGAALMEAVDAGGQNRQSVVVPDPRGGLPITMFVTATPVYATAKDPVTGEPLNAENRNPIAFVYDLPGQARQYGFQSAKDGFVLSDDPPWDESLRPPLASNAGGANHYELDLSPQLDSFAGPVDPMTGKRTGTIDLTTDQNLGGGWSVKGAKPAGPRGGAATLGQLVFDPMTAATSRNSRIALGGLDPTSDFHSLTLSTLMSSSEGLSVLANLDKNPVYKAQLETDAYTYAGFQRDMNGAWVPSVNADQNRLNEALSQTNLAANATSLGGFVDEAVKLWQRVTTGSPFAGNTSATQPGTSMGGFSPMETVTKLATDTLQNTPFAALGNVFQPQTSTLKTNIPGNRPDGIEIKAVGAIKVPTYSPSMPAPVVTQGPTAGPTLPYTPPPSQTSSQPPGQTGSQTGSGGTGTYQPPGNHPV